MLHHSLSSIFSEGFQKLKSLTLLFCFLTVANNSSGHNQTWRKSEIPFAEEISDGLVEDINRDGKKDLLLIAGNFINIYFQNEGGFADIPDERIYYSLLGEYIDVGEIDPYSSGLEILGLSDKGIKYYHNNGGHYVERPGYLIDEKVDMPQYRVGPLTLDFAFDINSDGQDEIFFLSDNIIHVYIMNSAGQFTLFPEDALENTQIVSLKSRIQDGIRSLAQEKKRQIFLYQPSVQENTSLFLQDLNHDAQLDIISGEMRLQEVEFQFPRRDTPIFKNIPSIHKGSCNFYLDIDGDRALDAIFVEVQDILTQNMNVFPLAKIFIYMNKNGHFAQTPDYFQKTILINEQPPFVDVDGDGDLDFISIWSEITPGSKEDIIQALIDSTWDFVFRCYRFLEDKGYSSTPDIYLKVKIKQDISTLSINGPFDITGDIDGNGSHDLVINRNPKSLFIYFLDLKAKKHIILVKKLDTPNELKSCKIIDLDGNGKSDILMFAAKLVRIYFSAIN